MIGLNDFYGILTVALNQKGWHDINEVFTYMFGQVLGAAPSRQLAYYALHTPWFENIVHKGWKQEISDLSVGEPAEYFIECRHLDVQMTETIRRLGVNIRWSMETEREKGLRIYQLVVRVTVDSFVDTWVRVRQQFPSHQLYQKIQDDSIRLLLYYDTPKRGLRLTVYQDQFQDVSDAFVYCCMPLAWQKLKQRSAHSFSHLISDFSSTDLWDDGWWVWLPLDDIWIPRILERSWRLDRLRIKVLQRLVVKLWQQHGGEITKRRRVR